MKAPFLYFFVSATSVPENYRDRFRDKSSYQKAHRAPSLTPGDGLLVTAYRPSEIEPFFFEEINYTWSEIEDGVFLGTRKDVNPKELERSVNTSRGRWRTFPDGHDWLIPICNQKSENYTLTQVRKAKIDKKTKKTIWYKSSVERYRSLNDFCKKAHKIFVNCLLGKEAGTLTLTEEEEMQILCDVLAINYDITDIELASLDVLSEDIIQTVVEVMLDKEHIFESVQETLEEMLKEEVLNG